MKLSTLTQSLLLIASNVGIGFFGFGVFADPCWDAFQACGGPRKNSSSSEL